MNVVVENLLSLQRLEAEIDAIRTEARVYPERVAAAKDIETKAKAALDAVTTKIEQLEKEHRDLSSAVALEDDRLKKSKSKLKDLKTNFEFQALQREIENTKRANTEMEETILKKMEEVETTKKQISELEGKWQTSADELRKLQEEASVKAGEYEGILSVKLEEQKKAEAAADKVILSRYRFIRDRRYQDALVPIIGSACQGCFMNIPHQQMNEIMRSKEVSMCPNCKRLIYLKVA